MQVRLRELLQATAPVFPEAASLQLADRPGVVGRFFGATITSAFQPLLSAGGDRPVAWEALARSFSRDGDGLSPWRLFADSANDHDLVALDRLCRAVHLLNFLAQRPADERRPLFLNVHPQLLEAVTSDHGAFFRAVLDRLAVDPARIIIDIPPLGPEHHPRIRSVVENYRRRGFRVALSATTLLDAQLIANWVQPDFLRLPARVWANGDARRLADRLGRLGVVSIATQIETEHAWQTVRRAGAMLMQGHWLGQPTRSVAAPARDAYSVST